MFVGLFSKCWPTPLYFWLFATASGWWPPFQQSRATLSANPCGFQDVWNVFLKHKWKIVKWISKKLVKHISTKIVKHISKKLVKHISTKIVIHISKKNVKHIFTKIVIHISKKLVKHISTKIVIHISKKLVKHISTKIVKHISKKIVKHISKKLVKQISKKIVKHTSKKRMMILQEDLKFGDQKNIVSCWFSSQAMHKDPNCHVSGRIETTRSVSL